MLLVLLCPLLLAACAASTPSRVMLSGETMGTTWHAILPGDTQNTEALRAGIETVLARVNRLMSTYDPESELSRFNQHDVEPFPMSAETLRVMRIAQQVSQESGGAFDITVGPIVNAYGFGPKLTPTPPSDEALAAMRAYLGHDKLVLDEEHLTATKKDPRIYCDLSAVAKGYGTDAVSEYLEQQGVSQYMVEIGGEVRTRGTRPEGGAWSIGIERPDSLEQRVHLAVPMRSDGKAQALATSGDYRNFFMEDGKRISHTIDGRSGRPIEHMLASASVLHDSCAWADAYATALMALGPDEGMAMAERLGLSVYLLVRKADGSFEPRMSTTWPSNAG